MMSIAELTQTEGWKAFMAKLYGWGAAVVIVGALFKIMHWPGASIMLIFGLSTEAVIFFFSAFEPIHREIDWSLVYPELSGLDDEGEMDVYKENIVNSRGDVGLEKFEEIVKLPTTTINSEAIGMINEGLDRIQKTAKDLNDITDVSVATKSFAKTFGTAAQSLDSFANTYNENSEVLKASANTLSTTFQKNAEMVSKVGADMSTQISRSGEALADSYGKITENITKAGSEIMTQVQKSGSVLADSYSKMSENIAKAGSDITTQVQQSGASLAGSYEKLAQSVNAYYTQIDANSQGYNGQLSKLGKNLSDLNSLYEIQLKGTGDHIKSAEKVYKDLDSMLTNLKESVDQTNRYKSELSKLSDSLASLNSIYGNMLSAMNIVKK